jgi:glycosyltransferase involved in cell wall biosynthesis
LSLRVLYICYFGLREPLVQTQVLPYLRTLTASGVEMYLLTFESGPLSNGNAAETEQWQQRLRAEGIHWFATRYRSRPTMVAKPLDLLIGTWRAITIARSHGISILHGRSDLATAMGWLARPATGSALLFDVRGLLADEYADAGHWRRGGLLHRLTSWCEKQLFRRADGLVLLTQRAREELFAGELRPIEVIPCCVDLDRFRNAYLERDRVRTHLGAGERTVIVYSGTVGGANSERDLVEILSAARAMDPGVYALVLTPSRPEGIRAALTLAGFGPADQCVTYVPPEAVPAWLAASDVGLSLAGAGPSRMAMSPAKFTEYLASGLPVIASPGVGDIDGQIASERVGVLLRTVDAGGGREAYGRLREIRKDPTLRLRCLAVAEKHYDVRVGAQRYRRIYEQLGQRKDG